MVRQPFPETVFRRKQCPGQRLNGKNLHLLNRPPTHPLPPRPILPRFLSQSPNFPTGSSSGFRTASAASNRREPRKRAATNRARVMPAASLLEKPTGPRAAASTRSGFGLSFSDVVAQAPCQSVAPDTQRLQLGGAARHAVPCAIGTSRVLVEENIKPSGMIGDLERPAMMPPLRGAWVRLDATGTSVLVVSVDTAGRARGQKAIAAELKLTFR